MVVADGILSASRRRVDDVIEASAEIEARARALAAGWRRVSLGTVEAEGDIALVLASMP